MLALLAAGAFHAAVRADGGAPMPLVPGRISAPDERAASWLAAFRETYRGTIQYVEPMERRSTAARIPRLTLQLASSPREEFEKHGDWMRRWRELNPDHEHLLMNDTDCEGLFAAVEDARAQRTWRLLRPSAARADVCRVVLLEALGGVYADTDIELHQPLSQFLPRNASAVFWGVESFAFLAFEPHHVILQNMAGEQWKRVLHGAKVTSQLLKGETPTEKVQVQDTTGPAAFYAAIEEADEQHGCDRGLSRTLPQKKSSLLPHSDPQRGWPCERSAHGAMRAVFMACGLWQRGGTLEVWAHLCEFATHHACGTHGDPDAKPCDSQHYHGHHGEDNQAATFLYPYSG